MDSLQRLMSINLMHVKQKGTKKFSEDSKKDPPYGPLPCRGMGGLRAPMIL